MKKKLTGIVRQNKVSPGSKSERMAYVLETSAGTYILRKQGENPFTGNFFENYLGKKVTVSGDLEGLTLFVDEIRE